MMNTGMKNLTIGAVLGFAVLVGGASATPAQAVTLDFETLSTAGPGINPVAAIPYTEDGFEITATIPVSPVELVYWSTGDLNFAGSTGLFANNFDSTITLIQSGNGAFSLSSIQLADVFVGVPSAQVTFTAQLAGGGTTMQSFGGASHENTFRFGCLTVDII